MKSIISFILFISGGSLFYSQLLITEVYYNTPFNEMLRYDKEINGVITEVNSKRHHRGEFVEIYNYSDKDINLKNWYLKDLQGIFWFPEVTIKRGEFMIIAYSPPTYNTSVFPELFATTAGKENQIIYQDQILLRNRKDRIALGYSLNGYILFEKSFIKWEFRDEPKTNLVPRIWNTPSAYYTIKSIQHHPNPQSTIDPNNQPNGYDIYNYTDTPNPLDATYVPDMTSYDELVKDEYQHYYSFLDWSNNVSILVNKICSINIGKISQNPSGYYSGNGSSCFSYDSAGNMISGTNCSSSTTPPSGSPGFSADELENIKSNITIYPNPVTSTSGYNVTISWSGAALGKIQKLQIFTSTGVQLYNYTPGSSSTSFNIQNQLPGTFVANFTLNSGQVVSKNILKW
ncbi:lamin tail domain-containing protein [Chryseobacterium sp. AG363]|uniref:lamin tail domain-containing protein n=1 Tax=Chryseobacterium sp. AG363 TaxID=2183997 RepID=UPI000FF669FB|nr:lamin tail domain-containing protein [Chryseobacterium sp. AG363]RKE82406.1 putative secreted protein (Por secretion system target) [Chryseobacterium sp. AG363]